MMYILKEVVLWYRSLENNYNNELINSSSTYRSGLLNEDK